MGSEEKAEKKPFYKRWWFITFAVVMVLGVMGSSGEEEDVEAEEPETEEVAEEEPEEIQEESDLPDEIDDLVISDVRGDVSGQWKRTVSSKDFNMPQNALAYYDAYMEEGEIHFLISFATNTTSVIKESLTGLYVDITEYEDKEEHDAREIGNGMLLKEYEVDREFGEITELDFSE